MPRNTIAYHSQRKHDAVIYGTGRKVRPVYIYCIDISEFAVNKLRDRGTLEVTTIVTNVQDFLVHLKSNL